MSAITGNRKMPSDKLCGMIQVYEQGAAYEKESGNIEPDKYWIQNGMSTKHKPKPCCPFKQFGWKPARIQVKPTTISEENCFSKNNKITLS